MKIPELDMKKTVAVFGLGAVGTRLSYFLAKLGFTVFAFEEAHDLLLKGGLATTNLSHNSGMEYCRRASAADCSTLYHNSTHTRTAELCIDGGIANSLIYGSSERTSTGYIGYTVDNPSYFLVAKGSLDRNNWSEFQGFSRYDFESNILCLRSHYQMRLEAVSRYLDCSILEAERLFFGASSLLGKPLSCIDGVNSDYIEFGVSDICTPINQAYEYALWRKALEGAANENLSIFFGQTLVNIKLSNQGFWEIATDLHKCEVDFVFLTGSYGNPILKSKIEGALPGSSGVFFLNAMLYSRLTARHHSQLHKLCNRGYFALQHDFGGMALSLVPLSPAQDGYVALYYPSTSPRGSQIKSLRYDLHSQAREREIMDELCIWNDIIDGKSDQTLLAHCSANILDQITKLYPFYKEAGIKADRIEVRAVFNADTKYGPGDFRNIRVPTNGRSVVKNGTIWELFGAKWTNSSLTALEGVDLVLKFFNGEQLPRSDCGLGLGLSSINVMECVNRLGLHVKDVTPDLDSALYYVSLHGFPGEYVNIGHEIFGSKLTH